MLRSRKRFITIGIIGLVLIMWAGFYIRFFLARPIGSGPAGPSVPQQPFDQIWTDKQIIVIGIGDSVTAGLGAASPAHSFFNRLLKNPDDEYADMQGKCLTQILPNLQSKNLAMSGSTSCQHVEIIAERLETFPDDVMGLVVMTSGGNDLIHSYGRSKPGECAMYGATLAEAKPWIDAYRARLNEMFIAIEDRFPGGCEIFIGDIYDPTDGVGDAPSVYLPPWPDGLAIHAAYNAVIRSVAESHPAVHVVPLHATFMGHGAHCRQFWRSTYSATDPHYWFFDNIEDPNDRGYDAIRRVFLNEIVKHSRLKTE